jgi:hypothetical protein
VTYNILYVVSGRDHLDLQLINVDLDTLGGFIDYTVRLDVTLIELGAAVDSRAVHYQLYIL